MYLYASHLGGFYLMDREQDFNFLYCESCGESDDYLGEVNTWLDAVKAIGFGYDGVRFSFQNCQAEFGGSASLENVHSFLAENFEDVPELEEMKKIILHECREEIFRAFKEGSAECFDWKIRFLKKHAVRVEVYADRNNLPDCFAELQYVRNNPNSPNIALCDEHWSKNIVSNDDEEFY